MHERLGERHAAAISPSWSKARLTLLVLVTTAVGFYLGARRSVTLAALFHAVFGTALAAAGAAALNQWWEHQFDALMHRTQMRPIPAGRMLAARRADRRRLALGRGGVSTSRSPAICLSAALAAATIAIYIFAYTPLKRISTTNTLVGAIPGALPPMIGWAARAERSRLAGVELVRDPVLLADAALLRDRLDVSRRLRARRFSHALERRPERRAQRSAERSFCGAARDRASSLPALLGLASRAFLSLELARWRGVPRPRRALLICKRERRPARAAFSSPRLFTCRCCSALLVLTKS